MQFAEFVHAQPTSSASYEAELDFMLFSTFVLPNKGTLAVKLSAGNQGLKELAANFFETWYRFFRVMLTCLN